ncbi:unannotated protein [freshwater metagenome]|uniref:Unannotated protein n=1 Tax=freshwater metagenome TaxID=449393 RepID=A0A6J7FCH6_9ZZZZ
MFDALANDEGTTLEFEVGDRRVGSGEEQLTERRHRVASQRAQGGVVGGDLTPSEDGHAFALDDALDTLARARCVAAALRQECDTGCVGTGCGELEIYDGAEERVRYLDQNARTVAGVRFGARGTAVLEVDQCGDRLLDDVATAATVHVHHECDTTRVVFVDGIVEALRARSVLHT